MCCIKAFHAGGRGFFSRRVPRLSTANSLEVPGLVGRKACEDECTSMGVDCTYFYVDLMSGACTIYMSEPMSAECLRSAEV